MNKFSPGKLMTAFFVFFFPILIFLGSWQVSRGMEKAKIVSQHNLNKSLPAIDEIQIQNLQDQELMYRTVNLEGTFGEQSYILDNRLYRQEAGYEVFTLFETSLNETYLVNRGWLSKEKIDMNKIFQEKKKLTLQGTLSPFRKFGLSLGEEIIQTGWPKYVQQLDYEIASRDLGRVQDEVLQLSAASVGSFEPIWKPVELQPSRHYGYAVQWFGLALVLFASYLYYGYRKD